MTDLQSLPAEILHRIFSFCEPKDATSLRLVCRVFASVGAEYYLPGVTVYRTRGSLERLLEISQHETISKHVTWIYYAIDLLLPITDIRTFYRCLKVSCLIGAQESELSQLADMEVPSSVDQENASPKVQFVDNYVRLPENEGYPRVGKIDEVRKLFEVESVVFHHPWSLATQHESEFSVIQELLQTDPDMHDDTGSGTQIPSIGRWRLQDLEKLFAIYQEYFTYQEKIREQDLDFQILASALPRLSRLQGVEIYEGGMCVPLQRSFAKAFRNAQFNIARPVPSPDPSHLAAILSPLSKNHKYLESLTANSIALNSFDRPDPELRVMNDAVANLLTLIMSFAVPPGSDPEDDDLLNLLNEDRLVKFFGSAPKLEVLHLIFTEDIVPDLLFAVHSYTWHSLYEIYFRWMASTEDELVDFLKRHSSTLRVLYLYDMTLDEGSWKSVLPCLRACLQLETAEFLGCFSSMDDTEHWDLNNEWFINHAPDASCITDSNAVHNYLVNKESPDECPLTDENISDHD